MSPVELKVQQQQQEMLYFSNDSIANPDGSDGLSSAEVVAAGQESQPVSPPLVPSNTCTPFEDLHGAKEDSLPFPEDEPHRFITQSTDSGTSTNDEEEKDEASKFRSSAKRKLPPETFERTRFKDVIGHGSVKMRIEEILLPLALPPCVADAVLTGIRALPASIMLYGPPGCGKTQLARSIAGEARAAFYCIAPSDVLSKFVGESEAAIRNIFRQAKSHAKQLDSKCAVVFLDEIDALGQARGEGGGGTSGEGEGCSRRILAELLLELNRISDQASDRTQTTHPSTSITTSMSSSTPTSACNSPVLLKNETGGHECTGSMEIDDHSSFGTLPLPPDEDQNRARVIVVAATNRIEDCDPALLRRFGVRVFVGPPSKRDRKKMFVRHLSDINHNLSDSDLLLLASATDHWSGSDIQSVAREAAMAPVRECIRAAVLSRKRAARREQQGASEETNPDMEARQSMIQGIQDLRPVSLDDFARAIEFLTTGKQQSTTTGEGAFDAHYDTSSDEED